MRVLQVIGVMDRGGAETMVMNLYRAMDRERIQFDFLVHEQREGDYDAEIERLGGRFFRGRGFRSRGLFGGGGLGCGGAARAACQQAGGQHDGQQKRYDQFECILFHGFPPCCEYRVNMCSLHA